LKLLFIGDTVGKNGCNFLFYNLLKIKEKYNADITVVNGENSHPHNGIDSQTADMIFNAGADVITTGNHCFRQKGFENLYNHTENLLRPANYPQGNPGNGYCILTVRGKKIAIVNLIGTIYTGSYDNPFTTAERIIKKLDTKNIFIDFHAEATAEKKTLGYTLDGLVTAVIGTHTHVQTADEQLLPRGTAFLTDAGMCGAEQSVLGMDIENSVRKIKYLTPVSFTEAQGAAFCNGAVVDFNPDTGKAVSIIRITER
jgi:metallophosphoesterase (TIGR00282 family)